MTTLSLRLPDSLHSKVRELAEADRISINQFIASAVAEKTSALATEAFLNRAKRGNRAAFDAALAKIPGIAPLPGDELPDGWQSLKPAVKRKAVGRRRRA